MTSDPLINLIEQYLIELHTNLDLNSHDQKQEAYLKVLRHFNIESFESELLSHPEVKFRMRSILIQNTLDLSLIKHRIHEEFRPTDFINEYYIWRDQDITGIKISPPLSKEYKDHYTRLAVLQLIANEIALITEENDQSPAMVDKDDLHIVGSLNIKVTERLRLLDQLGIIDAIKNSLSLEDDNIKDLSNILNALGITNIKKPLGRNTDYRTLGVSLKN